MSWIAEYDTRGREFPTCIHVTKTTGTMTHGATYVPIEDGEVVRAENDKLRQQLADVTESMGRVEERCAKLRELVRDVAKSHARVCEGRGTCAGCVFLDGRWSSVCLFIKSQDRMRELGIEVEA